MDLSPDKETENSLESAYSSESDVSFIQYNLGENVHQRIRETVEQILTHYERQHLIDSVYTIVKEMSINGAKANIKRIVFEELGIEADDTESYEKGLEVFRDRLNENWMEKYTREMDKKGLTVHIRFIESNGRLIVEVVNNVPVYDIEEHRIRKKLSECMGYDSLLDFYMSHSDETEGQGLGFSMIVILLKNEHIDPHLFTIDTSLDDRTIAKLEIPLDDTARTSREVFKNDGA